MEASLNFVSKIKSFDSKGDTVFEIFGVLEGMSSNFQEELAAAKEKQTRVESLGSEKEIVESDSEETVLSTPLETLETEEIPQLEKESSQVEVPETAIVPSPPPDKSSILEIKVPQEEISSATPEQGEEAKASDSINPELISEKEIDQIEEDVKETEPLKQKSQTTLFPSSKRSYSKAPPLRGTQEIPVNPPEQKQIFPKSQNEALVNTNPSDPQETILPEVKSELSPQYDPNKVVAPSQTIPEPIVNETEIKKVLSGLREIANSTKSGKINPEKISAKLLEALKNNPSKEINKVLSKAVSNNALQNTVQAKLASPQQSSNNYSTNQTTLSGESESKSLKESRPPFKDEKVNQLRNKVLEQIRSQLRLKFNGQKGEVLLRLNPKFLGSMKIRLAMEGDQSTASFVVDNQSVKEILQRSSVQLQEALSDHGFDVEEFEVSVAGEGENSGGGGKAFSSAEDQAAAREFLGSFMRLGEAGIDLENSDDRNEDKSNGESDQLLNVLV